MKKRCNTWTQNGIEIDEVEFDGDRHAFEVFVNGKHIVAIYPATPIEAKDMRADLDAGDDVRDWEDGNGVSIEMLMMQMKPEGDGARGRRVPAIRPGQLADALRVIDPDAQLDRLEGGHMADGGGVVRAHWRGPRASWMEGYAAPDLTGWDWDEPDAQAVFEDMVLDGMPLLGVRVASIDWLA